MPRLQGAWPASVVAAAPVLTGVSAILAAIDETPRAIGVFAALFPWILLLPVWNPQQLTAVRAINLVVWIAAFTAPIRWVFFGLTTALTLTLVAIQKRNPARKTISAPRQQRKKALDDETNLFL